ncbi:MAG: DUF6034 family protein, partial [Clostridiales bacterium]|nr:DUF6034 family protein [Clostridiales bacterium]
MKKLIALMLIVLLLLAGCTAAAPALDGMQKDREQLLATAASGGVADGSTLREQYDIPEQYKDTYAYPAQGFNGTLTVAVDADIIVPEGNAIPIYRIRAVNFSQEQIDLLWQALIGDTEMWQAATERTKAQILEEITELKELMNDARRLRDRFLLEPG